MKKTFLLFIMMVAAVTMNAQVFTEYFENATAGMNLEDYNDWYVSFKASEAYGVSPVIDAETLFYDGYIGSDIGKVAVLDSLVGKESDTQRISTHVVKIGEDTLKPVVGETMYAAFIVSILPNSKTSYRDFFTWEASSGSSFTRGRVFAKVSNANTDLNFAVSKNSSSSGVYIESDVMAGGVGVYHLLVLAYEVIEGDANDVIKLYINPDPSKPEAEQTTVLVSTDVQSDYTAGSSKIKINLRQRGVGAQVGGIRVGTNWEEVLLGPTVEPGDVLNVDMSSAGLVSGDRVFISGAAWNWPEPGTNTDLEMFDTDGDGIFSIITPICPNMWTFKFFKNTGWNGGEPVSADRVHLFTEEDETLSFTWGTDSDDVVKNNPLPVTFESHNDMAWGTFSLGPNAFNCSDFSIVANPATTGINTSANALQFVVNDNSDPWAGAYSPAFVPVELTEGMHTLSMMVYKTSISPTALKLEKRTDGDGQVIEVKVPNTLVNEWELLEFDFSAGIGYTFGQLVIFPDFPETRTTGTTVLLDNIGESVATVGVSTKNAIGVKVYPNPVSNELHVTFTSANAKVAIYNSLGRKIEEVTADGYKATFNVSDYVKGLYFVKVNNGAVVKFVK